MKTETFYETEIEHLKAKAKENPQSYLPKLGMLLNGYGVYQREKKAYTEAQKYHQAALTIYQELKATDAKEYLPLLVATLNNLSFNLQENRKDERAIIYADNAVEVCKVLVEEDAETYKADLAFSLNNLANLQSYLNNNEQAKKSYEESLHIYRQLTESNSKQYLPDLADLLSNLAIFSEEQKQTSQAVHYFSEALQIYKDLIPLNSTRYLKEVGTILDDIVSIQANKKQYAEVLKLLKENLSFLEEGAAKDSKYLPYLASLQYNLGIVESGDKTNEKSCQYFIDCIHTYIEIAKKEKEYFIKDISRGLRELITLAKQEDFSGDITLPSAFFDEHKYNHQEQPAAFLAYTAQTLNSLGQYKSDKKAFPQAVYFYKESINIWTFIEDEDQEVLIEKSRVIFRLGKAYSELGFNSSAENCYLEAQEIFDTLPETDILRIEANANIANNRAILKEAAKNFKEAEILYLKALKNGRILDQKSKTDNRSSILLFLNNLSRIKKLRIDLAEAIGYKEEAIAMYWKLERENPSEYLENLYGSYLELGGLEKANDAFDKSLKAYQRALDIAKKLYDQTSSAYQVKCSEVTTLIAELNL